MARGYRTIHAPTLEHLRLELEALKSEGFDLNVEWNGYDDGHLYSQPKDRPWLAFVNAVGDEKP